MRAVADRFDATADGLNVAACTRLRFDGASAGRSYVPEGDALHGALDRLAADVAQWSRASAEIAMALRISADRYSDAELRGAARL